MGDVCSWCCKSACTIAVYMHVATGPPGGPKAFTEHGRGVRAPCPGVVHLADVHLGLFVVVCCPFDTFS